MNLESNISVDDYVASFSSGIRRAAARLLRSLRADVLLTPVRSPTHGLHGKAEKYLPPTQVKEASNLALVLVDTLSPTFCIHGSSIQARVLDRAISLLEVGYER